MLLLVLIMSSEVKWVCESKLNTDLMRKTGFPTIAVEVVHEIYRDRDYHASNGFIPAAIQSLDESSYSCTQSTKLALPRSVSWTELNLPTEHSSLWTAANPACYGTYSTILCRNSHSRDRPPCWGIQSPHGYIANQTDSFLSKFSGNEELDNLVVTQFYISIFVRQVAMDSPSHFDKSWPLSWASKEAFNKRLVLWSE